MTNEKIEQRINLKFPAKHGKFATRISFHLLTIVCKDTVMSRPRIVFEWQKRFCEDCEEVEDEQRVKMLLKN